MATGIEVPVRAPRGRSPGLFCRKASIPTSCGKVHMERIATRESRRPVAAEHPARTRLAAVVDYSPWRSPRRANSCAKATSDVAGRARTRVFGQFCAATDRIGRRWGRWMALLLARELARTDPACPLRRHWY